MDCMSYFLSSQVIVGHVCEHLGVLLLLLGLEFLLYT